MSYEDLSGIIDTKRRMKDIVRVYKAKKDEKDLYHKRNLLQKTKDVTTLLQKLDIPIFSYAVESRGISKEPYYDNDNPQFSILTTARSLEILAKTLEESIEITNSAIFTCNKKDRYYHLKSAQKGYELSAYAFIERMK